MKVVTDIKVASSNNNNQSRFNLGTKYKSAKSQAEDKERIETNTLRIVFPKK